MKFSSLARSERTFQTMLAAVAMTLVTVSAVKGVTTLNSTNLDGTDSVAIVNEDGTVFPMGTGIIATGFVDYGLLPGISSDAQLTALQTSLTPQAITDIFDAFQVFGTGTGMFGGGGVAIGVPSAYSFFSTEDLTAGSPFIDQDIYTVVGDGSSLDNSERIFLYNHGREFIEELPIPGTSDINIAFDVTHQIGGVVLGDYGRYQSDFGGLAPFNNDAFSLVPEPSRAILFLIGLAAVCLRRRR